MRKARLHSTIEITVDSDMDDIEEVSNTEQGIEDYFTTQRGNIQGDSLEKEDNDKTVHDCIGIEGYIWMSELVGFDEDQDEHDIHDGGVELEADVAGTSVEDGTEDPLQNHAETHAVEQTVLLGQSSVAEVVTVCPVVRG